MNTFKIAAILTLVLLTSLAALGQSDVLVSGKNSLTRSDVNTLIDFYEWALEAKFTDQQRQRFAENTVAEFRSDPTTSRKTIDDIVTTYPKIRASEPDVQASTREAFLKEFLPLARQGDDENSQMLIEIHDSARKAPNEPTADDIRAEAKTSPGAISSLAGTWTWGRSGSMTKTTAGAYLGGNASRFTYEFKPDGSAVFSGIMTTMAGGCKMEVFRTVRGKASLTGDQLTINWQPASFSRRDSCSPSKDYKKTLPAEKEVFTVNIKTDYGQKQLCLTAKDETCYSPAN